MENKYQIIALCGSSGAGKDTLQNFNCKKHPLLFHKIISCTTRPIRDYEVQGEDYHFISVGDFARKLLNNEMLEATEYKTEWFYGTPITSLSREKINIGVFNPDGVTALLNDDRLNVIVIYVTANDKQRLLRSLKREENPDCEEICRRFLADKKDFYSLPFDYILLENDDGGAMDFLSPNFTGFDTSILKELWSNIAEESSVSFDTVVRWDNSTSDKIAVAEAEDKTE